MINDNIHTGKPLITGMFYGTGIIGTTCLSFVVKSWLLYFYLPPEGNPLVPVAFFGAAIFVGRGVGAILTPYIGYLSDNLKHPRGRRLPFMFWAAVPLALTFVLLWLPPGRNESYANLAYLIILAILFRTAFGFYFIPYQSLLPEIARSDAHRTRLSAIQSAFLLGGMFIGGFAGLIIDRRGFLFFAIAYGLISVLFLLAPLIHIREPHDKTGSNARIVKFWSSLKTALANKEFRLFIFVWAIYLMTTTIVQSSAPFIVTEVCRLRESDTVLFYIPGIIASLLWFPIVTVLVKRFGKQKVFSNSLLASAIVFPGTMLIGRWIPIALSTQCFSWAVVQAVSVAGIVVLSSTFVAEIVDKDEQRTGFRREGVYFGVMNVLEQFVTGFALFLLPLMLLIGRGESSPRGPLGVRLTGVFAGAFMFIGYMIFVKMQKDFEVADISKNQHTITSRSAP